MKISIVGRIPLRDSFRFLIPFNHSCSWYRNRTLGTPMVPQFLGSRINGCESIQWKMLISWCRAVLPSLLVLFLKVMETPETTPGDNFRAEIMTPFLKDHVKTGRRRKSPKRRANSVFWKMVDSVAPEQGSLRPIPTILQRLGSAHFFLKMLFFSLVSSYHFRERVSILLLFSEEKIILISYNHNQTDLYISGPVPQDIFPHILYHLVL